MRTHGHRERNNIYLACQGDDGRNRGDGELERDNMGRNVRYR